MIYQAVEAIVKDGLIQPIEAIEYEENTKFLLVRLTPIAKITSDESRRKKLIECFQQLKQSSAFGEIDDPVAWQKNIREDKVLFGRDET